MDSLPSLAAAAAAGNATATADLLAQAWPDAFRIAWSVLGERTAAEDAAQEACARTLTSIASLRRPEAFAAWFYRIVVNEARRRARCMARSASLEGNSAAQSGLSEDERIDLRTALRSLEPPLRLATVLRYYFNLSGSEIAEIVGASSMTVRWRLFVARRRLRAMLAAEASSQETATVRTGAYADERQAIR